MASKSQASSSKLPFSNIPLKSTSRAASSSGSSATAREHELITESIEYELKRLELYKKLEYSNRADTVATLRSDSLARIRELNRFFSKLEKAKASAHTSQPSARPEQPDKSEATDAWSFYRPPASPTGYEFHFLSPITSESDGIPESVQFQSCHVPLSEDMIPALFTNHSALFNMVESQLLFINQLIAERNAKTSEFGQWVLAGAHVQDGSLDFGVVLKFCGHSKTCFQKLPPRSKINLPNQPPSSSLFGDPTKAPTDTSASSPVGVFGKPSGLFDQPLGTGVFGSSARQPTNLFYGSSGGNGLFGEPKIFGGSSGGNRASDEPSGLFNQPLGGCLFGSPTGERKGLFTGSPGEKRAPGEPRKESDDSLGQPASGERGNAFSKTAAESASNPSNSHKQEGKSNSDKSKNSLGSILREIERQTAVLEGLIRAAQRVAPE